MSSLSNHGIAVIEMHSRVIMSHEKRDVASREPYGRKSRKVVQSVWGRVEPGRKPQNERESFEGFVPTLVAWHVPTVVVTRVRGIRSAA